MRWAEVLSGHVTTFHQDVTFDPLALFQLLNDPVQVLPGIKHVRNQIPLTLLMILRNVVLKSLVASSNSDHSNVTPELAIASMRPNKVKRTGNKNNRDSNVAKLDLPGDLKV